jgi:hypothetical protein
MQENERSKKAKAQREESTGKAYEDLVDSLFMNDDAEEPAETSENPEQEEQ